jgi:hypothetical protein
VCPSLQVCAEKAAALWCSWQRGRGAYNPHETLPYLCVAFCVTAPDRDHVTNVIKAFLLRPASPFVRAWCPHTAARWLRRARLPAALSRARGLCLTNAGFFLHFNQFRLIRWPWRVSPALARNLCHLRHHNIDSMFEWCAGLSTRLDRRTAYTWITFFVYRLCSSLKHEERY